MPQYNKPDTSLAIILGSARNKGETSKAVEIAFSDIGHELIDLSLHNLSEYDYEHRNINDDFIGIIDKLLPMNDIVFATPVYWYSMGGVMKIFFDRLSDLLNLHKAKGRMLKGKRVWLIATGADEKLPEGFEVPFQKTSDYFDMIYCGSCYYYTGKQYNLRIESENHLREFGNHLRCL